MKKYALLITLLGALLPISAAIPKRFDARNYPWNAASWCLIAGLGIKAYQDRYDEEGDLSYSSLVIGTLSAVSAVKGLYSLAFPTSKKYESIEVDSVSELVDELGYAIDDSKIATVISLLEKFDKSELSTEKRQQLLESLYSHATKILTNQKKKLSIFKSWRDSATVGVGAYLLSNIFSLDLNCFVGAVLDDGMNLSNNPLLGKEEQASIDDIKKKNRKSMPMKIGLSVLGAYMLYKGSTCSSQQWHLEDALEIQQSIKQRLEGE